MGRVCVRCKAVLNRYHAGNLCYPCQEKKQEELKEKMGDSPHYGIDELCFLLGLENPESVKRLGRKGIIPGRIPGIRKHLYLREKVDQWIQDTGKSFDDEKERQQPKEATPDPRFLKHTADVLNLLDTYASQLRMGYEPEDFITSPEGGAPPSEKESAFWFFAKKAVPSLGTLIDSQIDSESLVVPSELESDPSFVALESHYKGTKLWKDIGAYKKVAGEYVSVGLKLHRTMKKLVDRVFAEEIEACTFRSTITELIREDLAPVRVKLLLEGIETDKTAVLRRLPDTDHTSFGQGAELLQRYLNDEGRDKIKDSKLFADLQDLLSRIKKIYQLLRTRERDILRGLKKEKFKGQVPADSKCKFCP